jgi:pyridoxine 4-oxidase
MTTVFDVLVVGAGSAGSVVAARLSADPACRVGLVEAGGLPDDPDIGDPLKWVALAGRPHDWAFRTVPQPFTAGRVHDWPRGRVVGGSGCLHAMAHVEGHPADFEPWRAVAGDGWSHAALAPGFARAAAMLRPVRPDDAVSPLVRDFIAAGRAMGVPARDGHNAGPLIGATPNTLTIRDGRRLTVADAYLTAEVLARPNLTLLTGHEAERLEWQGPRATALVAVAGGAPRRIAAGRVVLCAGAVGTPLLLMRSGIGDPATLAAAGIACRHALPEVGRNLQDHMLVFGNAYRSARPVPPSRLQHSESLMYLDSADLTAEAGLPDVVVACVVAPAVLPHLEAPPYGTAFTLLCGATHPASRGSIAPGGPGRGDAPRIDPRYLEAPEDRAAMRRALRLARAIGHHAALDGWRAAEVLPGPATGDDDAALDAFVAAAASTHHHPAGTCRMGRDGGAVVDPGLCVAGFENLSVVDASVIPTLPSGPINAVTVAIAETWAARQAA